MNAGASRSGNFPGVNVRSGHQARTANTDSGFSFTTLPPGHTADAPGSTCGEGGDAPGKNGGALRHRQV
jgi:hypothetical protein